MNKKTYLFITDTFYKDINPTGAHRRFLELVREISKTNNIILVTREIPQLNDIGAVRYSIGEKKRKSIPYHISGMIDLCRTLKKIKKKIKYDYAISFNVSFSFCYKICGYRKVVSIFRNDFIEYQRVIGSLKTKIQYFKWLEKNAVKISDKIIVQCVQDKNNIIKRNKKNCKDIEKKVYIQINNVNASWMQNSKSKKIEGRDSNKIKILFIGEFSDRRKGHEILLPAFARLVDSGIKAELLIAGSGKELDKYIKQYKEYKEIVFLGRVSNMQDCFRKADFEIVPSLIDSCPNTVLEGLSVGIAVYGSNTGGIPDLLVNEKYLFEPNEEAIFEFLKDIIQEKRYIKDAIDQKELKEKLTFNWGQRIKEVIES